MKHLKLAIRGQFSIPSEFRSRHFSHNTILESLYIVSIFTELDEYDVIKMMQTMHWVCLMQKFWMFYMNQLPSFDLKSIWKEFFFSKTKIKIYHVFNDH